MTLHWIIQDNLYEEQGYDVLVETVQRFNLPHTFVKVVPFSKELIPDISAPGLKIVMGSISLGEAAEKRGWCPGAFSNSNFHFREWRKHYGEYLLNDDATICAFKDVKWNEDWGDFFIRPCLDNKAFAGQLMFWRDYTAWRHKVVDLQEHDTSFYRLTPETEVCYSLPRKIYQECRFFIVDGKVVTGSQYKLGRRVVYSEDVPPRLKDFAQEMVDLWQPHRAFALDIADTPNGPKVIEIGCLNSCGFYATNVQKLVLALNEMEF